MSTQGHKSDVRAALKGLMPYFNSPDIYNPKEAVKWLDGQAKGRLKLSLKRMKVTSQDAIQSEIDYIGHEYTEANKLRHFLKLAIVKPKQKDINFVREYLESRFKRYQELNTPEEIAKRKAAALKREIKKQKLEETNLACIIESFRTYGSRGVRILDKLPYELLRVQGDVVKTSRGAEVPLKEAKMLYLAIKAGKNVIGKAVGHFKVESITDSNDTKVIKIGCHKILLSEAEQVLGAA